MRLRLALINVFLRPNKEMISSTKFQEFYGSYLVIDLVPELRVQPESLMFFHGGQHNRDFPRII